MEMKTLIKEKESESRMTFKEKALQGLSTRDQVLFEEYGQGPTIRLPYQRIQHGFEHFAHTQPQQTAVKHLGRSITYKELDRQAQQIANELAHLGVVQGDNVGLFLERSIEMTVGIMGILKIGASYIPQDARITPTTQLRHIINITEAEVVLTLSHLQHRIPVKEGVIVIAIDKILEELNRNNITAIKPPDDTSANERLCFILFTSGTTGKPNGVKVSHQNVINILLTKPGNLGMAPGRKVSQILNISFDMCAWEILGSLCNGATLIIRGKSIQEAVEKVDIVIATPSILGSLDIKRCHNIQVVAVAGEPCPKDLADKWSDFSSFHNSCGPTETTIVNTMQAYSPVKGELTIGSPTPNNTIYILDEKLKPCPIGEVGEMWAGGLCVSNGYINNSELTNKRYHPDPFLGEGHYMFRTRDLGRWSRTGELQHFGRTDDQVKIKGFRVELDSISAALESVDGCQQAVTIKLDSQTLVSFVRPAHVNMTASKEVVESLLPYFCTPKLIIAVDEFSKTARGKINKRNLTAKAVQQLEKIGYYQQANVEEKI